jgi:hypothetical protein
MRIIKSGSHKVASPRVAGGKDIKNLFTKNFLPRLPSLDFIHRLALLKPPYFGNWICLRPQAMGWEIPTLPGPSERANINHWIKTFSFRNVVLFRIPDNERSPKTQHSRVLYTIARNL